MKELIEHTINATGKTFRYEFGPKRKGDPAILVTSNKKAKKVLRWKPKKNVKEMIKSSYEAYF